MTTEQADARYHWRVAAWESKHGRNFRSPFESTVTAVFERLLDDDTWKDNVQI